MSDEREVAVSAARQVLMNDLGLTREFVRAEAEKIIKAAIITHVGKLLNGGFIEKCVREEVDRFAASNHWEKEVIRSAIATAAGKAVHDQVRHLLRSST